MKQQFFQSISRVFPDGRPTVELTVKQLSCFRKALLFLAFILLPMTGWGGVTVFSSVSQVTKDGSWTITGSSNSASQQSDIVFPNPAAEPGFPTGKQAKTNYYCKLSSSSDLGAKLGTTKCITIKGLSQGDIITLYWFATSTTAGTFNLSYATGSSAGASIEGKGTGSITTKQIYSTSFSALTAVNINNIKNGYSGSAGLAYISCKSASPYIYAIKITSAGPQDPTIEFRDTTYEIGSGNLDLTKLFKSDSKGTVTYSLYAAGTTGASVSGNNFTATTAGTAQVIAAQAEESGKFNAKNDTNTIIVTAAATKSPIFYAETKGADMSAYPTQYTEGVGVASFADLADVPGFFFTGWNPASISSSATGAQTITAQWEEDPRCFIFTKTGQPTSGNLAAGDVIAATGGSMKVYSTKTTSSLKWATDGLNFSGGQADQVEIKLTKLLSVGTTIKLTLKNNSLNILDKNGNKVTEIASTTGTYTVVANDGLAGTVTFRIQRGGSSSYLQGVEVANCGGEASFHTVSFDMNGATSAAIADQSVLDGDKATKPADPTKTDHVFKGWVIASTGAAYDFNATVTADVALKAKWAALHNITYDKTKDADMSAYPTTYEEGVGVASFAALSDVEGFKFLGWDPSSISNTANTDQTITAQWQEAITYTVTYYDGTVVMGSETVAKDGAPTASEIDTKKAGYIFKNWCSDPELQNAVVLSELQITAATSLYAKYEKAYALSVDFASLAGGSTSVADVLAANYYTHAGTNTSWDNNTSSNNGAYQGLKMKASGTTIDFDVPANKLVAFKAGVMVNSKSDMYKDGTKVAENMAGGSTGTGDNFKMYYFYKADADAHYQFATTSGDAQVIKAITITDPYKVTFDATTAGGEAVDPMYFTGTALNLPTAVKTDWTFAGWFDNAELTGDAVVSPYTPTGDITLYAKFTQLSEDVSLKSLKYGETAIQLVDKQYTYNVVLPYKAVVEVPTVTAEKNDEKATMSAITQATAVPGQATFTVTAENTAIVANYTVNFTKGPKDPVCLIHADIVGEGQASVDESKSAFAGTATANSSVKKTSTYGGYTGYKFNSSGAKMSVALTQGTFKADDVVKMFITTAQNMPIRAYSNEDGADAHEVATGDANMVQGINSAVMTADAATLWLVRTDANGWNPNVAYVEVLRPMNPTITGISFNGVAAVVKNDANPKTISATVPYSTDFSAITIVDTIISNDNSKVTKNYPTTWVEGDNTIKLFDKDGDSTQYVVTLTKAAASNDATLKSLSVTGYTLDPAFAAETLEYTIERAYKDKDAELPAISYEVNYAAATAVKTTEDKVVTITVTAEDGTTQKAYTITFTNKAASTDATLKSLMYGDKAITLVADQYTYNVNLPYGTTDVPALTAVKNDELASDPVINNATAFVNFQATSTATVTAESGDEQVYTVNFKVAEFPSVVIFDGSTMQDMATSPDASGLSWAVVGSTMTAGDKNATYAGVNYTRSLSGGNSSATKHFTITVPENKMAKIRLLIMTNSNSSTRSAWITTSADKGNKEDAIMSVSSSSYTDLGDGTTDWLEDNTTYYIHTDNTVNFFVISVELKPIAPKCEVPTISAQPESNTQFGAGDMTASVTASVTDGGTLSYQWYNASDDSEVAGATAATLTTTTEGSYYVIITNTLADHRDNSVKSETAQLGYRKLDDATLSALGYGETAITLVDAQYTYEVELAKGTTEVPALTATTSSSYATKVITNATAFVDYKATSTVVVTAEDGTTQLTYTVNFTVRHDVELQDVTGDMTWDFTNSGAVDAQVNGQDGTYLVLANCDGVKSSFNGQYMSANFNKITTGNLQGKGIKIHTTTPGLITIEFSNTGNKTNNRVLYINGEATTAKSKNTTHVTYSQMMPAGDIVLTAFEETASWNMLNYYKITFTQATRLDRSDLTAGKVTGVCLENNVTHFLGAKFYYLSHKATDESYIELASVDTLKEGYPYIMIAEGKDVYYMPGTVTTDEAQNYNGLYGTFVDQPLGDGYCIFLNNKYYRTHDGNNNGCYAHRAYLKLDEVSTTAQPAPGEEQVNPVARRIRLGSAEAQTATGFDMIGETELGEPRKFIINDQVVIIRNGQMYNAQGAQLR